MSAAKATAEELSALILQAQQDVTLSTVNAVDVVQIQAGRTRAQFAIHVAHDVLVNKLRQLSEIFVGCTDVEMCSKMVVLTRELVETIACLEKAQEEVRSL